MPLSASRVPAARSHATLPSKVQALTESDDGEVALWDIPSASCVRREPPSPQGAPNRYDALLEELEQEKIAVPSWFTLSSRSGALEVTLEPSLCFNAEAYASDLRVTSDLRLTPPESELRINLGERLLASLFHTWRLGALAEVALSAATPPVPPVGTEAPPPQREEETLPTFTPTFTPTFAFADLPLHTVCVIDDGVVVLRCAADALPSVPPDDTPRWLLDTALFGRYEPRESLKISFVLEPHPSDACSRGGKLPELRSNECRLSAPRALKLAKVLQYVDEKLGRAAHPNGFELSCADNVLRPDMSLGTARAFFWKQGGDMLVHYREVPAAQGPSKEVSPSSTEGPKDDVAT